ncbi:glycerophosphodiester phosphodiesterase [Rhodospirillales bacterium]|nr:glycerophosphodiester phosphodiesterase [Rhodospirillales bacterium]
MAQVETELPFVIGHRGAAGLAPENTLTSIIRAKKEGATWVEFDVMLARYGEAILFHDETIDRTTNGSGAVADLSLSELRKFDAGLWFDPAFLGERIPTFVEAMVTLAQQGLGANVEIKPTKGAERETATAVARLIKSDWPSNTAAPVISSFSEDAIAVVHQEIPEVPRAMLFWKLPTDWREIVSRYECDAIHMSDRHLTLSLLADAAAMGLPVRVYTVNDPERARALRDMGVQSIFTDRPDLIKD